MRHKAFILAAFGLILTSPVSAAMLRPLRAVTADPVALPVSIRTRAGILPTSPISFIDRAFDALSIAVAITPAAKTEAALKVAQENAAEAAVMSSQGNVDLTTRSLARVDAALGTAVVSASKVADPTAAVEARKNVQASTEAAQQTLQLGVDATPTETRVQIHALVNPTFERLSAAPAAIGTEASATVPRAARCDTELFASCMEDNGCTFGTSQKCFLTCPPKDVPCQAPMAGKTCSIPDTACVNTCLQKIVGCTDACLAQADCKKDEVSTSTLQIIGPDEVRRGFQLQLQGSVENRR